MTALPQIHALDQVIDPQLIEGAKLCSYEACHLTQPGDNYGSVLIAINAKLQRPDESECYSQQLVAKVPPTDANYWQFIQPERTCLTENAVYKCLAPALSALQESAGVPLASQFDGFGRCFGSRISLDANAQQVDKDAVLLLENLQASGYKPGQRLQPYDLPHTLLALKYMAQFHALPIALRLQQPDVFETQVRPFFKKFDWHAAAPESKATMKAETLADIQLATNNDAELVARVKELSDIFFDFLAAPDVDDGPFTSIIHCDFWINNLMFLYDTAGSPMKLKILDFQTAQYDSVVHDIIAFLLSSVDTLILEQHYEQLLRIYYEAFVGCLREVKVETSSYSYEAFRVELKRCAYIQVPHAIFMTRFILADNKDNEKELELSELLRNTSSNRVRHKLSEILRLAQKFDILN